MKLVGECVRKMDTKCHFYCKSWCISSTHSRKHTHTHTGIRDEMKAVWERPMCGDMIWCIFLHPESSDQLYFHLYSVHFYHAINFFSIRCLSLLFHMDNFFFYLFLMNFKSMVFFSPASVILVFVDAAAAATVVVIVNICLCRKLHVIAI